MTPLPLCQTCARPAALGLGPSRAPNSHTSPRLSKRHHRTGARIPRLVIAAAHGVVFGFLLDALCAVDACWTPSESRIGIEEVDVGLLAADKGTLAWLMKPFGNASLLHEFAQSARTFGAEEARRSHLGLASRVFSRRATCVWIEQTSHVVPRAHHKQGFAS